MLLQEEQIPIFQQILAALVEATPEWWSFAMLELVTPPLGLGNGVAHSISNSDYPRDVVLPTDELFEATRRLELACKKHGDSWKRCVFRIQEEGESWRYVAEFER